jgi:DNA invertase Pin-like site-specific DNA recombinase
MKITKSKIVMSADEFNDYFEMKLKKDGQPMIQISKGSSTEISKNYIVVIKKNNLVEFNKILSIEQIKEIKVLKEQGMSLRKIGEQFKVSHTTIHRALKEIEK